MKKVVRVCPPDVAAVDGQRAKHGGIHMKAGFHLYYSSSEMNNLAASFRHKSVIKCSLVAAGYELRFLTLFRSKIRSQAYTISDAS